MMAKLNGWELAAVDEIQRVCDIQLEQNHPNPFNPETEIRFQLTKAGWASLEIFRITGQRVACLHEGILDEGNHSFRWDGCDGDGYDVSSGIYLYRLHTADQETSQKMTLIK